MPKIIVVIIYSLKEKYSDKCCYTFTLTLAYVDVKTFVLLIILTSVLYVINKI